jgi:thiamine-phosphate pyrophosphorylase
VSTHLELPPGLYALCDDGLSPERSLLDKGRALLLGGARVIQLRAKRTPVRALAAVARTLARECEARGAFLLVNDRADVALATGAHGVHVGDEDLSPGDARAVLGRGRLVGVTVRGAEDIRAAHRAGADYVGLGPVFATSTKRVDAPPLGVEKLAELVRSSPLPVVAIAGIGLGNIAAVAAAGVRAAAVGSDLLSASDIAGRARLLSAEFRRGWGNLREP